MGTFISEGKFYKFINYKFKNYKFSKFSWQYSIHEMAAFGFFGPSLPQIWLNFAEILTRVIFQNFVLRQKRDVPKVYGFGPFLGSIYPRKMQNIAKDKDFPKNYILRAIK